MGDFLLETVENYPFNSTLTEYPLPARPIGKDDIRMSDTL